MGGDGAEFAVAIRSALLHAPRTAQHTALVPEDSARTAHIPNQSPISTLQANGPRPSCISLYAGVGIVRGSEVASEVRVAMTWFIPGATACADGPSLAYERDVPAVP